jgi:hypothetical protein
MAQADKDGDGVLTFDEFVIVSKKFPNILVSSAAIRLVMYFVTKLRLAFSSRPTNHHNLLSRAKYP